MNLKKLLVQMAVLIAVLFSGSLFAIELKIEGNDYFDEEMIYNQMGVSEDDPENQFINTSFFINLALSNLEILYQNNGFYKASFKFQEKNEDLWLLTIDEGPIFKFGNILLDIDQQETPQPDMESLPIKSEEPFKNNYLTQSVQIIRNFLQSKGYIHTTVKYSTQIDTLQNRVHTAFRVHPGPKVRVSRVQVHSQRSDDKKASGLSDPNYVRSLFSPKSGDSLTGENIRDFKRKLLGTGLFRKVQVVDKVHKDTLDSQSAQFRQEVGKPLVQNHGDTLFIFENDILPRVVEIRTIESVPGSFSNRIFWEELLGFGWEAELRHKNIVGRFHDVRTGFTLAQNRQKAKLAWGHPLFLGTNIRFDNQIVYNRDTLPIGKEIDRFRSQLYNVATLSKRINQSAYMSFESRLSDDSSAIHYNANDSLEIIDKIKLKFEGRVNFDFTNSVLNPTKGYRLSFALGNAGGLERDERFSYGRMNTRWYLPFSKTFSWAAALDMGLFFDAGQDIEDAEIFYQGGYRSVRGWEAKSIKPQSKTDSLDFGLAPEFFRVSNEFRFDLTPKWQLVQFVDYASVQDRDETVYEPSTGIGAGLGVRYRVGLLMIRLDVTIKKNFRNPLDFLEKDWGLGRFQFDLSQAI